jgi:hypothetical protein
VVPQKSGGGAAINKYDSRYSSQAKSTWERQEEKAKEERVKEEKAKEEKAKEEKAKEEKAREERMKEERAKEEKLKEEKAKEERERAKAKEVPERARSKTDEEVRRADPRLQSVTPPPFIVKGSSGGILTFSPPLPSFLPLSRRNFILTIYRTFRKAAYQHELAGGAKI